MLRGVSMTLSYSESLPEINSRAMRTCAYKKPDVSDAAINLLARLHDPH